MWRFIIAFFLCLSAYSQPLSLKIDSISIDDQDPIERIFMMHYHLENLTNQSIIFIQDTGGVVASIGGSGTFFLTIKSMKKILF